MSDISPIYSADLSALAEVHGVATSYEGTDGQRHRVASDTVRSVLGALDVPATTDEEIRASLLAADEAPWRRVLPPSVVTRAGRALRVPVHAPDGSPVRVHVVREDGGRQRCPVLEHPSESREIDGRLVRRVAVEVPSDLPTGWHRLEAFLGDRADGTAPDGVVTLLVAPRSLPPPDTLRRRRAVGLAAQLYQVTGRDSWGIGDFADLARLGRWAAGRGCDFVLINPVHAAAPVPPREPSPYLPTSRLFLDPLYLRIEDLPEYRHLPGEARERVDTLARSARALSDADRIDRDAVWEKKLAALSEVWEQRGAMTTPAAHDEFARFRENGGGALERFAVWCVLAERHGPGWRRWPEDLRSPDSPAVDELAARSADRVSFHIWLQFRTAGQLGAANRVATEAGMRVGVLTDLAVGVHPEGADAWIFEDSLARRVTVGAPPDAFNQRGQDWSQPPPRPDALAETGYAMHRDLVRAALRGAGGARIDHILGMFRLWWIPEGAAPGEGTYVHYDPEAMLGVIALEAERAGPIVVGEDLGTVPPTVRGDLRERGVLGTSILWFEQDAHGPIRPATYRRPTLASVTTHDLPPTAGYLDLAHVDIREQLGLVSGETDAQRRDAAEEIRRFRSAMIRDGVRGAESIPADPGATADPGGAVVALHRWLSTSPSLLLAVALADLVGDRRPINQPGTSDEYPNWRLPLTTPEGRRVGLEELESAGDDELPARILRATLGE